MRIWIKLLVFTTALIAGTHTAAARPVGQGHPFGLGVMLGAPTGLSGKYFLGHRTALQLGLGAIEGFGDDGLHVHVDVVWHPVVLTNQRAFSIPFYMGVGGRVLRRDHAYWWNDGYWHYDDSTYVGVRMPLGLTMDFKRVPMDVFFELALVVDLFHVDHDEPRHRYHHDSVDLNAALGVRYYF